MRLNKFLAACGLGSRRSCERLIAEGIVTVNGVAAQGPFQDVDPETDTVVVGGETVRLPRRHVYLMLNKPRGYVTTSSDPHARKTVMSLLPRTAERLFPVGRLDRDSEGLLLFTSDGELAYRLTHPRWGVRRYYRVDVSPAFPSSRLRDLERGAFVEGELLSVTEARIADGKGHRLDLVLVTGKKREIRRLLEAMGFEVRRIFRWGFGPLRLGDLPEGATRPLSAQEVRALKGLVGVGQPG